MKHTHTDEQLMAAAQKWVTEKLGGNWPSNADLAKHLHVRNTTGARIKKLIQGGSATFYEASTVPPVAAPGEKPTLTETSEVTGDKWVLTLPKTNIHTLEELIEYCKIDLNIWRVDRFVANKWEMGYKNEDDKARSLPLFQIKAWLVKKPTDAAGVIIADEGAYIAEIARLRSRIEKQSQETRAEKRVSKHLALNHMGADEFLNKIHDFMQKMGDISLPYVKLEAHAPLLVPPVRSGHTEDAVFLLSDTHFGDRSKREDTAGFPEFNLPISGNRFGYVIGKEKQVLALHRAMYPIKTLYIWLGGDIGNGILHDSPNSNELFTPAQVHFSYHMVKFAIEDLLTLCEPDAQGNHVVEDIKLLFTVGNHMRMDEHMPHKFQAQRTLDWLIYQFVIERFKGNPHISIKTEMAPYIFETIRGHRHLFCHGMQVGYRNNPDAQCKSMGSFIDRVRALFDSPEWRRQNQLMGETFAKICIGDIHVPVSFPRLLSNGSLNGQNELGVNWVMEPIPAGQQIFGVSDKHLETWRYFLDCTDVQDKPEDRNSYGDFARNYAADLGR
jgi:hypothetical protein